VGEGKLKKKLTFDNFFKIEPTLVPPYFRRPRIAADWLLKNHIFLPCACADERIFMKFRIGDLYQ